MKGVSSYLAVMLFVLWIVLDTLKSAMACSKSPNSVPAHIGTLVRNLIIVQGIWIVVYFGKPDVGTVAAVAAGVFLMRYFSELLSIRFSSS